MTPATVAMLAELLKPAGEELRKKLAALDNDTLGHVVVQVVRAHTQGRINNEDDLRQVVHEATEPRP